MARAGDLEIVVFTEDRRWDYGEVRYRAFGYLDGEAHCLAFADRNGVQRVISLRRAREKEMRRHVT